MNGPRYILLVMGVVAAGLALGATPAVAQGGCAACVDSHTCDWITSGSGSSKCWVENGQCHEAMDICVVTEARLDLFLREELVLVDGRSVRAVPLAPEAWFARACDTGRAVVVLARGDGSLELWEEELATSY